MKKIFRLMTITALLVIAFSTGDPVSADPPEPPGGHGYNGNVPVGAPIDGGLSILLVLGLGYWARVMVKEKQE